MRGGLAHRTTPLVTVVAAVAVCVALAPAAPGRSAGAEWDERAPLPIARTEVAAARVGSEIVVAGGLTRDGRVSRRVDAYAPKEDRWRQLPDLPGGIHHAMAVGVRGRFYVLGGYGGLARPLRRVLVLEGSGWRRLAPMPFPRAAAGVAVVGRHVVVAGGVGVGGLARSALALDLDTARWSVVPGPTPREHLAATSAAGTVYAVGGRSAGFDTNLALVEAYRLGDHRWHRLPNVPRARGGTGAAAVAGLVVSVGGEAPSGTIREVYAFDVRSRRWRRLADLPTPRHGLGVVAAGGRVYAIGGGPEPGLAVSSANEALAVTPGRARPRPRRRPRRLGG